MAQLVEPINNYRFAVFSIANASELDLLPTTTSPGKDNLQTIKSVCGGSVAYTTDGNADAYILDESTDTWKLS